MKKLVISLAICLSGALCFTANAQSLTSPSGNTTPAAEAASLLKVGDNLVTAGIGAPFTKGFTPTFSASYERILWDIGYGVYIGLGAQAEYLGYKSTGYDYDWDLGVVPTSTTLNFFELAAMANVHYSIKSFDIYSGVAAGYVFNNSLNVSSVHYSLGARYFFNDKFAAGIHLGGLREINATFTVKF